MKAVDPVACGVEKPGRVAAASVDDDFAGHCTEQASVQGVVSACVVHADGVGLGTDSVQERRCSSDVGGTRLLAQHTGHAERECLFDAGGMECRRRADADDVRYARRREGAEIRVGRDSVSLLELGTSGGVRIDATDQLGQGMAGPCAGMSDHAESEGVLFEPHPDPTKSDNGCGVRQRTAFCSMCALSAPMSGRRARRSTTSTLVKPCPSSETTARTNVRSSCVSTVQHARLAWPKDLPHARNGGGNARVPRRCRATRVRGPTGRRSLRPPRPEGRWRTPARRGRAGTTEAAGCSRSSRCRRRSTPSRRRR